MAENKNNFLLPNRLDAVVAKLSDKQAGVLFKSILAYANKGTEAVFDDGMVAVVFEMARQEIDYNTKQYVRTCEKNALNGKLGGAPKGNSNAKKQPVGCFSTQNKRSVEIQPKTTENNPKQPKTTQNNPNDMSCYDVDVDMSCYDKTKLLTAAQKSADPKPSKDSLPKDPNEGTFRAGGKTIAQKLACWWVKNYYPKLYETAGKKSTSSWYARYGKSLNEILNLSDGSLPLAVSAILATQEQMRAFQKRKGEEVTWGLEAVSRNFTENFVRAQEILHSGQLPQEVQNA